MSYQQTNNKISSSELFADIEKRIKTNFFNNKEDISKYVNSLKERGFLTEEEINELLGIYDNLNQTSDMPLQMDNYKGVQVQSPETNLIVGTQERKILATEASPENITQEFKEKQNQIIAANGTETPVEAPEIFAKMVATDKIELQMMSIPETLSKANIDKDVYEKIRYFITNKNLNPEYYYVDPQTGIFYNMDVPEILEVRKDPATNQYHIYRDNEIVYEDGAHSRDAEQTGMISMESSNINSQEDLQPEGMEAPKKDDVKRKVLRREPTNYMDNAAFSNMNFLLLIISMFTASIVFINILSKIIK